MASVHRHVFSSCVALSATSSDTCSAENLSGCSPCAVPAKTGIQTIIRAITTADNHTTNLVCFTYGPNNLMFTVCAYAFNGKLRKSNLLGDGLYPVKYL